MRSCFDVAKYILEKKGPMTTMKLQKLIYYIQAWSLVWDEKPLFGEKIEAWINGPVVRELYSKHSKKYSIDATEMDGNSSKLSSEQKDTIDAVLQFYGGKTSQWLSDLTHLEDPWKNARKDVEPSTRGNNEILHSVMMEYYSSIQLELCQNSIK